MLPMIKIKDGVFVGGISTEILLATLIIYPIFAKYESDLVITSGTEQEANHAEGSRHWGGDAKDFRIWYIAETLLSHLKEECQEALGEHYYVRLEKDHLHISWKPKKRRMS